MSKRSVVLSVGLAMAAAALGGCGVSVPGGGENAATHPASGIWVSPTVGAGNVSGHPAPVVAVSIPPNTPPASLPSGLSATETAIESAVTGGCWEDSHEGDVYGAYDQLFWFQGQCASAAAQVTVELYPTVAKADAEAHHDSPMGLLDRFQDGAVLVDVFSTAPVSTLSQLATVKGLVQVPGYGD